MSRNWLLAAFWLCPLLALTGSNSGTQPTVPSSQEPPAKAAPSVANWSSPERFTLGAKTYAAGRRIDISPVEDIILALNEQKTLTVRFHWRPGSDGKHPTPGAPFCAKMIYPVRDRMGTVQHFHGEVRVELSAEGKDAVSQVDFKIGLMPLDFTFTQERDCLFYLAADFDSPEPVSNLLVLRCR